MLITSNEPRKEDEGTKNHKSYNGDITTAFMPEMKDNRMCPVQSYLMYLYSLTRDVDALWQTPKFTNFPEDPKIRTWYGPIPVGHNPHESFVSRAAKSAGLQEFKYLNHCLHVTAITNLKRKKCRAPTSRRAQKSRIFWQKVGGFFTKVGKGRTIFSLF